MVWNYHDKNDLNVLPSSVQMMIDNIPSTKVLLSHYRIDQDHSNSYSHWKQMGSPQNPTDSQIKSFEKAGQLHLYDSPEWMQIKEGKANIEMELPRQAVSLITLNW